MPAKNDRIPDELLLSNRVWDLQRTAPLSPRQVQLLTGLSIDQLKERRRMRPPKPPLPFQAEDGKAGTAIWYPIGEVLDYVVSLLPVGAKGPMPIRTFTEFLGQATPADVWPFARLQTGQPIDFFASLRLGELVDPDADCGWLSLTDFLDETSAWIEQQRSGLTVRKLGAAIDVPVSNLPSCLRCGAPDADGHRCRL
ncbi:MAG: hypothetical protein J0H86_12975 [Xanthomonadaceae bacterium]|nr:hypothetical protein [Xanthomonadaceae bacterium]